MHRLPALIISAALCLCCSPADPGDFTSEEKALIHRSVSGLETDAPEGTMRVLTISDPSDLSVLRSKSSDLSIDALLSSDYEALSQLMVATVTHPSQDGVGIAGPQVGINRRIVAVQRFDKEGEPFEVYPNIRIVWASDSLAVGPEGCLSVPDRRDDVLRSTSVVIEYADIQQLTLNRLRQTPHAIQGKSLSINEVDDTVPMVRDTINGFTAVIFQHETDHLDGVLYIDRL